MKPLQNIQANRENSLLLVIDIENDFCRPGGMMFKEEKSEEVAGLISTTRRVIDEARAVGVPIIYVQSVRNHREPEFTVFEHYRLLKFGTWYSQFVDELTPEPGDIVVRKWCHDPWYGTDLERVVQGLVPDPTKCQALITGGAMMGCAFFGATGFYIRNYRTVLVLDAGYGNPMQAGEHFSRSLYPTFPNITLTRSDLIQFSKVGEPVAAG